MIPSAQIFQNMPDSDEEYYLQFDMTVQHSYICGDASVRGRFMQGLPESTASIVVEVVAPFDDFDADTGGDDCGCTIPIICWIPCLFANFLNFFANLFA